MCYYFCWMEEGRFFLYNDKFYKTGELIISANNRSFRYGDGFFETMKIINGEIALSHYHYERLFSSLQILKFNTPDYFTHTYLSEQIKNLIVKNSHQKSARVRVTIFSGDNGLYEDDKRSPNYIIQSWPLNKEILKLNENGLVTDIYKDARKTCDAFSHIKHNNYLPYAMAALWAKENKLNDAFLLNNLNRVADATIANIFIVKDGSIKTPALTEGCIAGVMRRHLIKCINDENIPFEEAQIEAGELLQANEIFLTNAIRGIRWVKQCGKSNYTNQLAKYLDKKFI